MLLELGTDEVRAKRSASHRPTPAVNADSPRVKIREAVRLHLCSLLPCCGRTVRCREHAEGNRSCECRMTRGCIMPCSHGRCWQGRSRCRLESWKCERGQGRNHSVTRVFILLIARAAVGRPPRTQVTNTAGLFLTQ